MRLWTSDVGVDAWNDLRLWGLLGWNENILHVRRTSVLWGPVVECYELNYASQIHILKP